MNVKLKLGIALFILGLFGVLTMLTVTIPLDSLPNEVLEKISPETLKYLVLINPTILLLLAVLIGTLLFDKVGFSVPTISSILKIEEPKIKFIEQIKFGVLLGLLTGILTTLTGFIFKSSLPQEFIDIGNKIKITTIARFGYDGITEELLMRFGFMTLVVWIIFKITKKLGNSTYWIGIILASILFAVGHFPVVFNTLQNPTISLLTYVLIGNSIAGLFFGWLNWKKGLEAAFIGHIFAHVAMIIWRTNISTSMIELAAHNRRLEKKRVQLLNEALCFVSISVLAESFVLRNLLLRQAPNHYVQLYTET